MDGEHLSLQIWLNTQERDFLCPAYGQKPKWHEIERQIPDEEAIKDHFSLVENE